MNFRLDQFLSLSQKLSSKNSDSGCSVTNLFILSFGDINKNFSRWIINEYRLQNSRTIVCHGNLLSHIFVSEGLENLIHTLWSKSGLDQVSHSDGSNK